MNDGNVWTVIISVAGGIATGFVTGRQRNKDTETANEPELIDRVTKLIDELQERDKQLIEMQKQMVTQTTTIEEQNKVIDKLNETVGKLTEKVQSLQSELIKYDRRNIDED